MAHIRLPELDEMTPRVREKAENLLKKQGYLNETFRLLAIREDIFDISNGMASGYLMKKTELPFATKERIALLVSLENSCKMCVNIHTSLARRLGMSEKQIEEVKDGIDAIDCDEAEKMLLRLCLRGSGKEAYKILKEDIDAVRDAGYTDSQILEAIAVTAYFNYINTISSVFGLEDEA